MQPRRFQLTVTTCIALGTLSCPPNAHAQAPSRRATRQAAPQTDQITISGRTLLKDGVPWVPKLMPLDATLATPNMISEGCTSPILPTSYQQFLGNDNGASTFRAIKALGADTVRITLSESGLVPGPPNFVRNGAPLQYDPNYLARAISWVQLARGIGLNVIVTMKQFVDRGARCQTISELPDEGTTQAWRAVAPRLADDQGVLLELFTEPNSKLEMDPAGYPGPADWTAWRSDFNNLIATVRATGAKNVLVIQGLVGGKVFNASAPVTDPINNYMYGIHIYFTAHISFKTRDDWDSDFGNFCRASGRPCLVTEWQASGPRTTEPGGTGQITRHATGCDRGHNIPQQSADLISYLMSNHWGFGPWAFDFPDTVMVGYSKTQPTTYANWNNAEACNSPPPWGNGTLVLNAFNSPAWGK